MIEGGPPVALSEQQTQFIYNLLPVGHFYDKRYGEVWVTPEKLNQMEKNFGKYPAYEVPVKIGHGDGAKSPGKVKGLEITMTVDAETAKAINDKQYRYMSAEFDENYQDKETGEFVGAVLLGAALVNQPANPYMEPLVLVDDIEAKTDKGGKIDMNEVEELRKQLAEKEAQLKLAQEENEAGKKSLADLEAQNKALIEERERADNAKNEAEVKAFSDKWTAQGIPPAVIEQVKPVLLGKSSRVIKLSDNDKDDKPALKFFDDLFAALPKIPMTQISSNEAPAVELSDTQKAIEHAKLIAGSLNHGK